MRKKIGDPKGPSSSTRTPKKPLPSATRKLTYVCLKCKRTFALLRHLKKHMQGHEKNDCDLCDELFTSRKQFVIHMRDMHSKRVVDYQHFCKFCDKSFTRKHTLFKHYQTHAKDKLVCYLCGEFFKDQNDLDRHTDLHDEIQYCCALCHQNFTRKQQYDAHLLSHEKYQCLTCKKGFSAWKVLLEHQQSGHTVTAEKPSFKCDTCSKQFLREACLKKHRKKHVADKTRRCEPCSRTFLSACAFENHLLSKSHKYNLQAKTECIEGAEFECDICKKCFGRMKSLTVHKDRVHHNRSYECHVCKYRTKFKTNLTRHIKLHFNERSFVCELCGAAFFNMSALKDHHTFLHTESRDFVCSECSKSFKRSSELTRHMKSHSDSRPYVCSSCDKSFKRSSHLKRHREKCHNDLSSGRTVDRYTTDDAGHLVLKPVEKKAKKPQAKRKSKRDEDFELQDEDTVAPLLTGGEQQYYIAEGHADTLYIPSSQNQPINLQICLEQPIDLEMPKNYVSGETLDLAKPRSHFHTFELLESSVRISGQITEELFPRQSSPPLYLTDLSRYPDPQMPLIADFAQHTEVLLGRDDHHLNMSTELIAEDMRIQQQHFSYL